MSRSCWYTDKKCPCGSLIATNGKEEWCEHLCSGLISEAIKESNKKHEEMFKKLAE